MSISRLMPILVVALAGCATMGGLREDPLNAGKSRHFEAPFVRVVDAARQSMIDAKLQIEEAYRPSPGTQVLLAKKGTSFWSWGELVRVVVVEGRDETDPTIVRVLSKRKSGLNFAAKGDYSEAIFSGIELGLIAEDPSADEASDMGP